MTPDLRQLPGHDVRSCLFCEGSGPYSTVEHIIPESLGNDDLVLSGEVCDKCQWYFGKEVERYVLEKTPIGAWRALIGIRSKRGRLPHIDLSVPTRRRGVLPEYSNHHDNQVGFTAHQDGSTSVDLEDPAMISHIIDGSKTRFQFVLSPKHVVQMGRFFGKIALELYCLKDPDRARNPRYQLLRRYTRYGISGEIWPVFHRTSGTLQDLRHYEADPLGVIEHSLCYEFAHVEGPANFELFTLRIGTDQWVICTNDPFPTPIIKKAFAEGDLSLIWYSRNEWAKD